MLLQIQILLGPCDKLSLAHHHNFREFFHWDLCCWTFTFCSSNILPQKHIFSEHRKFYMKKPGSPLLCFLCACVAVMSEESSVCCDLGEVFHAIFRVYAFPVIFFFWKRNFLNFSSRLGATEEFDIQFKLSNFFAVTKLFQQKLNKISTLENYRIEHESFQQLLVLDVQLTGFNSSSSFNWLALWIHCLNI